MAYMSAPTPRPGGKTFTVDDFRYGYTENTYVQNTNTGHRYFGGVELVYVNHKKATLRLSAVTAGDQIEALFGSHNGVTIVGSTPLASNDGDTSYVEFADDPGLQPRASALLTGWEAIPAGATVSRIDIRANGRRAAGTGSGYLKLLIGKPGNFVFHNTAKSIASAGYFLSDSPATVFCDPEKDASFLRGGDAYAVLEWNANNTTRISFIELDVWFTHGTAIKGVTGTNSRPVGGGSFYRQNYGYIDSLSFDMDASIKCVYDSPDGDEKWGILVRNGGGGPIDPPGYLTDPATIIWVQAYNDCTIETLTYGGTYTTYGTPITPAVAGETMDVAWQSGGHSGSMTVTTPHGSYTLAGIDLTPQEGFSIVGPFIFRSGSAAVAAPVKTILDDFRVENIMEHPRPEPTAPGEPMHPIASWVDYSGLVTPPVTPGDIYVGTGGGVSRLSKDGILLDHHPLIDEEIYTFTGTDFTIDNAGNFYSSVNGGGWGTNQGNLHAPEYWTEPPVDTATGAGYTPWGDNPEDPFWGFYHGGLGLKRTGYLALVDNQFGPRDEPWMSSGQGYAPPAIAYDRTRDCLWVGVYPEMLDPEDGYSGEYVWANLFQVDPDTGRILGWFSVGQTTEPEYESTHAPMVQRIAVDQMNGTLILTLTEGWPDYYAQPGGVYRFDPTSDQLTAFAFGALADPTTAKYYAGPWYGDQGFETTALAVRGNGEVWLHGMNSAGDEGFFCFDANGEQIGSLLSNDPNFFSDFGPYGTKLGGMEFVYNELGGAEPFVLYFDGGVLFRFNPLTLEGCNAPWLYWWAASPRRQPAFYTLTEPAAPEYLTAVDDVGQYDFGQGGALAVYRPWSIPTIVGDFRAGDRSFSF